MSVLTSRNNTVLLKDKCAPLDECRGVHQVRDAFVAGRYDPAGDALSMAELSLILDWAHATRGGARGVPNPDTDPPVPNTWNPIVCLIARNGYPHMVWPSGGNPYERAVHVTPLREAAAFVQTVIKGAPDKMVELHASISCTLGLAR